MAKNFVLAPRSLPINILLVIDCRTYLIHSTYLRALRHISIDCITILIEKNAHRSYRQRPSDEKFTPNFISMSCNVCFIVSLKIGSTVQRAFKCLRENLHLQLSHFTRRVENGALTHFTSVWLRVIWPSFSPFPGRLTKSKRNEKSFTLNRLNLSLDHERHRGN